MLKLAKQQYEIRNWEEYNSTLKLRGKLTFLFSKKVSENWLSQREDRQRAASPSYIDVVIATMGTIQALFHLAGRQTKGGLESFY